MSRTLILALLAAAALAQSLQPATARATVAQLRAEVRSAMASEDYAAMRAALERLAAFTHNDPATIYNLACTYALAGEKSSALTYLERWASMALVADAAHDPDLASLADEPRFKSILATVARSRAAVTHSATAFTQTDSDLLTEDLAYDPRSRNFFVTSVLKKKVLRIAPDGRIVDFADLSSNPGWPLFAVHADTARNSLWVSAAAIPDFGASPKADYGRTALLRLELGTGRILDRIAPPDSASHAFGDLDIAPDGTVIVSDTTALPSINSRPAPTVSGASTVTSSSPRRLPPSPLTRASHTSRITHAASPASTSETTSSPGSVVRINDSRLPSARSPASTDSHLSPAPAQRN